MAFVKGKSGNPGGKPHGETAKGRFRAQVEAALPSIVAKLIESAQEGDVQAASIILSKIIPNQKPASDPVSLPMATDASLADKGMQVLSAAASGQLAPDDAQSLMNLLAGQSKLIEQSEVLERLEVIEQWLQAKGTA